MAAAGRPLVRRLPDVGAPRRRRAGVCGAGAAQYRADGAAGRRRRHPGGGREMPLVTAAFKSGTIGRESEERQADSPRRLERGGRAGALRQPRGGGADPSDRVAPRARPARWNAPTSTARATCCTCCPRAPSPTSATWRCRGPARASATASSGSTSTGDRRIRQPERDLGLSPDGPDRRARRPQPGRGHPAADLRPVRGPGTGRPRARLAGRRFEHAHGGRRGRRGGAAAHAAAGGARRGRRARRC